MKVEYNHHEMGLLSKAIVEQAPRLGETVEFPNGSFTVRAIIWRHNTKGKLKRVVVVVQ